MSNHTRVAYYETDGFWIVWKRGSKYTKRISEEEMDTKYDRVFLDNEYELHGLIGLKEKASEHTSSTSLGKGEASTEPGG